MSRTKMEVVPRDMRVNGRQATVESDTTLIPARSLDALASTIRHEHNLVENAAEKMLEHVFLCGEALREAKSRVERGKWRTWTEDNIPFSHTTVNFYMRAAFHMDLLRETGVRSLGAARSFLQEHDLVFDGGRTNLPDEDVDRIYSLSARGMSTPRIAAAVGCSPETARLYLNDPERRHKLKPRGTKGGSRRHGRKKPSAIRVAITDDLVEGAAIKLHELFGDGTSNVTDTDRDTAVEILRAAFAYNGPIPGEALGVS